MYNLVAIGDIVIDTHVEVDKNAAEYRVTPGEKTELCFEYGSKIPILHSLQTLGGNAANVASGVQRLGLTTAVVSTVGKDSNGDWSVAELKKRGVDTQYISVDPHSKTRYSIILNYAQERTILAYSDAKTYAWPHLSAGVTSIYYTGLSAGYESVQRELITFLTKHRQTQLIVNPGSYMLKYALPALMEILPHTDILILNLEEAEKITGTTLAQEKNIAALMHHLMALGPREVAITDSARGAWAGNMSGIWHMGSFPVPVVSKTGAGDAFAAGYTAARALGHDIVHALSWGIANSSGVVQERSSQDGLLDQNGVALMLKKFPSILPKAVAL